MSFFGKKDDPFEPGKSERENAQRAASGSDGEGEGDDKRRTRPSNARIAIWVVVGGIGLYLVGSGLYGILTH